MTNYMMKKNLSSQVISVVKKYIEYSWDSNKITLNEKTVFDKISETLKDEIITYVNGNILKRITVIYYIFSSPLIEKLLYYFEEELYGPDEKIISVFKIIYLELFNIIKFKRKFILINVNIF